MSEWTQNEIDADMFRDEDMCDDEDAPGLICGRWRNSKLTRSCDLAGTEECEWECPHHASLYRTRSKPMSLFSDAEVGASPSELDSQSHQPKALE